MAFCHNCGQQIPEGAGNCPACGAPVFVQQAPQQPQYQQAPQQPQYQQPQYQQTPQQPVQPVAYQPQPNGAPAVDPDAAANKGIAWLAYLGLFLLIPLFARKSSEYCKYHVKQGAVLFLTSIAYTIVTQILLAIINAIFPGSFYYFFYAPSAVYTVFNVIFSLGNIFFLVLAIIGIVNAATGQKKELFLLGKIKFIDPLMDKIYAALNK